MQNMSNRFRALADIDRPRKHSGRPVLPSVKALAGGGLVCCFCKRNLDKRGTRVLERIPDQPGYYRLRCRRSCTGVPFVFADSHILESGADET